ncbi:3-oxoacyl-[acyl-carrier-protein] reductase [Nocardia sp. NPDC051321]|uniref:3-oxoacyl-[acyl-carrier-protein] reductase n=1 Tax=Nocardia sp. NPDC051321 TaxID=3364323 RepID=UPI0037B56AB4
MSYAPVVLVTGASRGIGRAITLRLARSGYRVAGCFTKSGDSAEAAEAAIRELGISCYFAPCDIRDEHAVDEFVRAAEADLGPLTALVNNAGLVRDSPLALMSRTDWQDVVDTNLGGTWAVSKSVIFRFLKRRGGSVVTISSIAGLRGTVGQTNYAATKAGLIGMSKSLAKEVARYGIRVNVVAPGFIETDMTDALTDKQRNTARSNIPLDRFGRAEDVADVVEFLLSERSSYITGQVLAVDGGMSI